MANTKVPIELSSTPGIVDNSTATAITIDGTGAATFSGDVGIGGAPLANNQLLLTDAGTYSQFHMQNSTSGSGASDGFRILMDGVNTTLTNHETGYMAFETQNTERLRIDSAGSTIIRSGNKLILNRTDNATGGEMSYVAGTGFIFNDANGDGVSFNVGAANKVRIVGTTGNVGIGTTTPAYQLTLSSNPSFWEAGLQTEVVGGNQVLKIVSDAFGGGGRTGNIEFHVNAVSASPAAKIDASGNLLVGKSTATYTTTGHWINGSTGQLFTTSLNGYAAQFMRNGTDGILLHFYNDGVSSGSISVAGATSSFVGTSDPRVKTHFSPITDALALIEQTVENGWLGSYAYLSRPGVQHYGYNAHELIDNQPQLGGVEGEGPRNMEIGAEYEPAFVDEDGNEIAPAKKVTPAGVDPRHRVPLLEAAIYDLLKMNEALTARLEALEGA